MRKCSFENRWAGRDELNVCDLPADQRKAIQEVWDRRTDDSYYPRDYRE